METVLPAMKALSEGIRVRILLLLVDREACVCELMQVFGMAQSKLSHHLITLRDAGFLQDEKRGKWNYYKADTKALNRVNSELVLSLFRLLIEDPTHRADVLALEKIQKQIVICG